MFLGVVDAERNRLSAIEAEFKGGDEILQLRQHAAGGAMLISGKLFDADAFRGALPLTLGDLPFGTLGVLGQRVADDLLVRLGEEGGGGFGRAERRDEGEEGEEAEGHGVVPVEPRKPPMVATIRRSAARWR